MKKAIALILALMFIMSMIMNGCSDKKSVSEVKTDSTPVVSEEKSAEVVVEEAAKPVKLTITWWGSQTRHDYTAKLLEMYTEKYPNVTFESTPSGWDGYFDKMAAQAAGNILPDIVQMDYSFIATYTQNNTLADLTQLVADKTLDMSDVQQAMVDTGKVGGKLTGAVLSSTSLAVPYNPDVFAKAGLSEPASNWTWSDFEKTMLTIKEKTGNYGFASDLQTDTALLTYWVRQYGKTLYAADGTKLGYDDDNVFIDYLNMVSRLTKAKAVPTADAWLQIATTGKEARPVVVGTAGAMFEWANFGVIVEKANPNIKLVTPPYADNGTKALWIKPGMFFSIAETSDKQAEAAKFISWFINDIDANKLINTERGIPVATKIREALKPSLTAQQKAMFDYLDTAIQHAAPASPAEPAGSAEVIKAMADQMNLVLFNKVTPEQAAADFRKTADEILKRNSAK